MLDAVRAIPDIAAELGDDASAELAGELCEQVPGNELNLLVVGQFKRGKSTLINALLGDDVMPTGALPLTGVATAIRYGDEPRIEVRVRRDHDVRRISVEELAAYVTERCNPANVLGVERIDVAWPSERIRGFAVFDTPGVGSVHEHNTSTAIATLPRADAAILVVGPEPPIGLEEVAYAKQVAASSERLFVVLNKADLAGEHLPEILAFTQAAVARALGGDGDIVALSATTARDAQRAGGEDADFTRLLRSLHGFRTAHGPQTRERSLRRRALAIVARLDLLVTMRREALRLPLVERESRRDSIERALQLVDDRVRALELIVDDDVRRIRLRLEDTLDRLHDADAAAFLAHARELSEQRSSPLRAQLIESIVEERVAAWRGDTIAQAEDELGASAAKYGRLVGEIEHSVLEAGCQALHIDAAALAPRDIAFAPAQLKLVASLEPTTGLEIVLALFTDILPAPLRRQVLRRRYDRVLASELDALRGKLRYGIAHDLEPWRRGARQTIVSCVRETRSLVLQAFEERPSSIAAEQPALERLDALHDRLAALRESLAPESTAC